MSSDQRPTIRVTSTQDLLALIPFILGFEPDNSLVLLAVDDRAHTVVTLTRLNLPTTDEQLALATAAVDRIIAALRARSRVSVVVAGYGPTERVDPMVAAASGALDAAGIPIREAVRVESGRFWRLRGVDPAPSPPDGVPFEAATSPATAAAVYAGLVALPDRATLAATLAPVTGPARQRMIEATTAASVMVIAVLDAARTSPAETGEEPDAVLDTELGQALQAYARTYLTQTQDRYRARQPADDKTAALLTVLLQLPTLWDVAARTSSGEPWQIEMWSDLVRRAEPPFTAATATLLALSALQAGHGPLASMAVDRALEVDPHDDLAPILRQAIAAGIDPDTVTALLAR